MAGCSFVVYGIAQPKGSTRAFLPKGSRRPIVTSDNPSLKAWETVVRQAAQAYADSYVEGPVRLSFTFWLPKPKSAPKKRIYPTTRPDLSKLIRSTEDALSGVLFGDDAQVVAVRAEKWYAEAGQPPSVVITVDSAE